MKSKETKDLERRLEGSKIADDLFPDAYRPKPGDLEVTQYRRPHGTKERVFASVGEKYVDMAKDKNLVISAEWLPTGKIVIWVQHKNDPVEKERTYIADNGPGKNSPTEVLKRAIEEA